MKQVKLDKVTYEMLASLTKKSKFNKVEDYLMDLIRKQYS